MRDTATHSNEVPLLVLNEDAAHERLVAIWGDADRLGLRIERVGQPSTGDAIGDRLRAHATAWERVATGNNEFAIVAEDDVGLDERLLPLLDATRLRHDLDRSAVVNLDGGPSDATGPSRIVPATRPLRSFGAYIVDRTTADVLVVLAQGASSVEAVLDALADNGIAMLVATPPPVASSVVEPLEGSAKGWLSRTWRTLTGERPTAEPTRLDRNIAPDIALSSALPRRS